MGGVGRPSMTHTVVRLVVIVESCAETTLSLEQSWRYVNAHTKPIPANTSYVQATDTDYSGTYSVQVSTTTRTGNTRIYPHLTP